MHVLSFQAEYACRHSTNCCTAPWGIALDDRRADRVAREIDAGGLSVPRAADGNWLTGGRARSPGGVRVLRRDDTGACVFLDREGGRCAIHRACGHDALPEACQQFPRVTLLDDRGIHVTLSHYCPTVTALALAEPDTRVSIVSPPSGFARAPLVAGLDARGHWPPLLRPGVMCSSGTWSAWEAWVVDELANGTGSPWATLGGLARAADEVRAWRSVDGDQQEFVRRVLEGRPGDHREHLGAVRSGGMLGGGVVSGSRGSGDQAVDRRPTHRSGVEPSTLRSPRWSATAGPSAGIWPRGRSRAGARTRAVGFERTSPRCARRWASSSWNCARVHA